MPQAGYFYTRIGRDISLGAGIARLAVCMGSHFPIPKKKDNTPNELLHRGSRVQGAEKQPPSKWSQLSLIHLF